MKTPCASCLLGFGLTCVLLAMGQSCGGPAPAPPPPPDDTSPPPPQVTACGLLGNNCEVFAGDGPNSVAIADLDADGDNDLAVANFTGDSISILLNNGTGKFTLSENGNGFFSLSE